MVTDVWPAPWVLPFKIHPIGNPDIQLPAASAIRLWPYLNKKTALSCGVAAAMNITGVDLR